MAKEFRFRFSLRGLLIALFVLGAGFGILGRLFRQNPQIFAIVVAVLSSIVPYLFAVGTIVWIGVRRKQLGLCLLAILLIVIPFAGAGVIWFSRWSVGSSPGNLAMIDTKQLIEVELPKQIDGPWVWDELEARLASGQLSQEEAEAAVGQLIAHMKSERPRGWEERLSWAQEFIEGVDRKGMLSGPVKFGLCDAFFGTTPDIYLPRRLREGATDFRATIRHGSARRDLTGLKVSLLWHIDRVLLDGVPFEVKQDYKHGSTWAGISSEAIAVGEHEVTVEMTCAYIDLEKLIGLDEFSLPPTRWPSVRKQWKSEATAPLSVFTADEPLVKLITDANLDPSAAIQVLRCVVQAGEANKKQVIAEIALSPAISMSCDVSITLGGESIPLGSQWIACPDDGDTSSGLGGVSAIIESLDRDIEYADITLLPNPVHIEHQPFVTEIWGKPITLYGVPVERLDLEIQQADQ